MMDLEQIFRELNEQHFGGRLAPPKLSWNERLSSTAGRFSPGSRHPLRPRTPLIEVASYLREIEEGAMHVTDTLLHEMIHYQLWAEGKPYGHTEEFHAIMRRVGAKRYNPVPKTRPYKHWYECPHCRKRVPARRKIGNSACMQCCRNFAGGRYDPRFRLELVMSDGVCLEEEQGPGWPAIELPINGERNQEGRGGPLRPEELEVCEVPAAPALPPAPAVDSEARTAPTLPPSEIIRRLEELKQMVMGKLKVKA